MELSIDRESPPLSVSQWNEVKVEAASHCPWSILECLSLWLNRWFLVMATLLLFMSWKWSQENADTLMLTSTVTKLKTGLSPRPIRVCLNEIQYHSLSCYLETWPFLAPCWLYSKSTVCVRARQCTLIKLFNYRKFPWQRFLRMILTLEIYFTLLTIFSHDQTFMLATRVIFWHYQEYLIKFDIHP